MSNSLTLEDLFIEMIKKGKVDEYGDTLLNTLFCRHPEFFDIERIRELIVRYANTENFHAYIGIFFPSASDFDELIKIACKHNVSNVVHHLISRKAFKGILVLPDTLVFLSAAFETDNLDVVKYLTSEHSFEATIDVFVDACKFDAYNSMKYLIEEYNIEPLSKENHAKVLKACFDNNALRTIGYLASLDKRVEYRVSNGIIDCLLMI